MPKFEIYVDSIGEYRWRLVASNGETVAASEGYTTKQNAQKSCEAVKRIASEAVIEDIMEGNLL
jgi:uncharacterized protein YegP (UPF0339 family)